MDSSIDKYLNTRVIDYTIDEFVGRGRYGVVYKAHSDSNQIVAVKIIELPTPELIKEFENAYGGSTDELEDFVMDIANKFVAETESMMRLSANDDCTNIIKYIDHRAEKRDINWRIFIVMEFATPFKQYSAERAITVGEIIDLGIDIAAGLKTCHNFKIIHRDIKEDNIFYGANGRFKIGDFGVANMTTATRGITQGVGSEYYMAPEVKKGEQYSGSVDIYSLGIVLYKLFNYNRYPFAPKSSQGRVSIADNNDAFNTRMSGAPVPPPEFAPPELAPVIQRACAYDKNERYAHSEEFMRDLIEVKRMLPENVLNSPVTLPAGRRPIQPSQPAQQARSEQSAQVQNAPQRDVVEPEPAQAARQEQSAQVPPIDRRNMESDNAEEINKTEGVYNRAVIEGGEETTMFDEGRSSETAFILPVNEMGGEEYDESAPAAGESTVGIMKILGPSSAAGRKLRQKIEQLENEKVLVMEKQRKIRRRNIMVSVAAVVAIMLAAVVAFIWPQTIEYRADKADGYAIHKYQFGIDRGRIQKNDGEVIGAFYLDTSDKDWLYFSQKEDELVPLGTIQPSPLYKIKRNGTQLTMISDKHCEYDVYYDGWVYFVSYYEDRALCRVTSDGAYDAGTNGIILSGQPVASLKMTEKGIIEVGFDDGSIQKYDVRNAKNDYTQIIEVAE